MPKAKNHTYSVRCRAAVAQEMARYEHGAIVAQGAPQYDTRFPAGNVCAQEYMSWLFTISGPQPPNIGRWASFGVTVPAV